MCAVSFPKSSVRKRVQLGTTLEWENVLMKVPNIM